MKTTTHHFSIGDIVAWTGKDTGGMPHVGEVVRVLDPGEEPEAPNEKFTMPNSIGKTRSTRSYLVREILDSSNGKMRRRLHWPWAKRLRIHTPWIFNHASHRTASHTNNHAEEVRAMTAGLQELLMRRPNQSTTRSTR